MATTITITDPEDLRKVLERLADLEYRMLKQEQAGQQTLKDANWITDNQAAKILKVDVKTLRLKIEWDLQYPEDATYIEGVNLYVVDKLKKLYKIDKNSLMVRGVVVPLNNYLKSA